MFKKGQCYWLVLFLSHSCSLSHISKNAYTLYHNIVCIFIFFYWVNSYSSIS